jgi:isopentenyl phosphate kinase
MLKKMKKIGFLKHDQDKVQFINAEKRNNIVKFTRAQNIIDNIQN